MSEICIATSLTNKGLQGDTYFLDFMTFLPRNTSGGPTSSESCRAMGHDRVLEVSYVNACICIHTFTLRPSTTERILIIPKCSLEDHLPFTLTTTCTDCQRDRQTCMSSPVARVGFFVWVTMEQQCDIGGLQRKHQIFGNLQYGDRSKPYIRIKIKIKMVLC
jgi:hypothetical protein